MKLDRCIIIFLDIIRDRSFLKNAINLKNYNLVIPDVNVLRAVICVYLSAGFMLGFMLIVVFDIDDWSALSAWVNRYHVEFQYRVLMLSA